MMGSSQQELLIKLILLAATGTHGYMTYIHRHTEHPRICGIYSQAHRAPTDTWHIFTDTESTHGYMAYIHRHTEHPRIHGIYSWIHGIYSQTHRAPTDTWHILTGTQSTHEYMAYTHRHTDTHKYIFKINV